MASSRRKVTIADVARHLGVAKGTVSRALNGYADVAEPTRRRVLSAVEDLGYRPSSLARNLKRGRVETIGIVVPMTDSHVLDPFFAEFLDGVSQSLDQVGQDLLLSTAHSPADAVAVHDRLIAAHKVDGFIVTRTEVDDPRISYLRDNAIPFVAHGRTAKSDDYAWFDIDNEAAFLEAVRYLAGLGHRRIGLLGGRNHLNFAHLRLAGYRHGLAEAGLDLDPALAVEVDLSEDAGFAAALALMGQARPPTALIAVVDAVAIGAIRALRHLGLAVGHDVSVVGYDGIPVGAHIDPPLTTFSQSVRAAGARVARMLIDLIEGADPTTMQDLEQAVLIRRHSDGPPAMTPEDLARKLTSSRDLQGRT